MQKITIFQTKKAYIPSEDLLNVRFFRVFDLMGLMGEQIRCLFDIHLFMYQAVYC